MRSSFWLGLFVCLCAVVVIVMAVDTWVRVSGGAMLASGAFLSYVNRDPYRGERRA